MKILFVCGAYPKGAEKTISEKCMRGCGIQNAPNVFQWSVIDGLRSNDAIFDVVSFPFLPTFPFRYRSVYTEKYDMVCEGEKCGETIKYCTLMAAKAYSIKYRLRKYVKEWIEKNKDNEPQLIVLIYQPLSYYLTALAPLKREYPNVSFAAIVTDLVDDALNFKSNRGLLKRVQLKNEQRIIKAHYKYIDKFVLLTKYMEERIPEAVGKNIVIEGICTTQDVIRLSNKKQKIKTLLYTGTLEEFAGVVDLVNAFLKIANPDFRLIICGAGTCASYIKQKAAMDSRIIFKGLVDRDEVVELQKKSTIVINPRKPTEGITRYSFPSKTMEYLISGTPMIGYKLPGIPEEYYPFFYTVDDCNEKTLIGVIEKTMSLTQDELDQKAMSAYRFIHENKSSKAQMKRFLDFLAK